MDGRDILDRAGASAAARKSGEKAGVPGVGRPEERGGCACAVACAPEGEAQSGAMPPEAAPILEVRDLTVEFPTSRGVVPAVVGVDLDVRPGEIVGLVGESGCGKSVTSLAILGLIAPPGRVRGEVRFAGRNLVGLPDREMAKIRGCDISMIFQEPMTSLNPVLTVGRQVSEAILIHSRVSAEAARRRGIELFELCGIPEAASRYDCYPHQLSGGLRQRAMIAMALACEPRLLVADEPTTALDVTIQAQILDLMKSLRDRIGTAILLITHDLGVVAETCDRVTVMYAGRVQERAEVFDLYDRPLHPYTQGLLRSIPGRGRRGERLYAISGTVPNLLRLPSGCRFHPRCDRATEACRENEPSLADLGGGHQVRCRLVREGAPSEEKEGTRA